MLPLLLSLLSPAQALDPGPYTVSSRSVTWLDDSRGLMRVTVHYPALATGPEAPADVSGGPYPLAAFLHGWLGSAWMYSEACDHLASLGLVVVNMDTETHPFLDVERFARDTVVALEWADDRSLEADHWLAGMVSDDDWTAMGHSMGGATLARVIDFDPRVRTLIGFMPYESDREADYAALSAFDGQALYLVGTEDVTSTPPMVQEWFDHMDATERGLYANIVGAGHQAVSNFEWGTESMPDPIQQDVVLTYASQFLEHEVLGEPRGLRGLLFEPPAETTRWASRSHVPRIWLDAPDSGVIEVGTLAELDAELVLYAGRGPGATPTPHGPVDLADAVAVQAVTSTDGIVAVEVPISPALAASWVQVAVISESGTVLGPPTDLFGVGLPDDDDEPLDGTSSDTSTSGGTTSPGSTTDPGTPASTDDGGRSRRAGALTAAGRCGGCTHGGSTSPGLLLALLLFLRRQR